MKLILYDMSVLPSEIKYSTDFEILKIHFCYSVAVNCKGPSVGLT
jgi:hypothetical protein